MNKKLFDSVMAIMSAIGAIAVAIDLFLVSGMNLFCPGIYTESREFSVMRFVLGCVLFVTIILYVVFFRKRHTDLYDLQYTMAKNNKLHPLRALAVITNDYEKGRYNKLRILRATITYELQHNVSNDFNVKYGLSFQLFKRRNQMVTDTLRRFRLYALSEDNKALKNVSITIDGHDHHIPLICSGTLLGHGGDHINRFAGLNKIQVVLPERLDWKNLIELKVEYLIENQISLFDGQYSFVIIPKNYSPWIREITVEFFTDGETVANLHCQRIGVSGVLETVATFSEVDKTTEMYRISFKPNMQSVYFIQFDLPRNIKLEE